MCADTEASVTAKAVGDALLPPQPPSSPIDGYGTPHLSTPVPPRTRSQTSSTPRLQLMSSSAVPEAGRSRVPSPPEEVDELDEFDAQLPLDLDAEVCERLEAESLLTANRRRRQQSAPINGGSIISSTSSQGPKRARNITQDVIDLRDDSREPSPTQKRSKAAESLLVTGTVRTPSLLSPEQGALLPALTNGAASQSKRSQSNVAHNWVNNSSSSDDDDVPLASLVTSLAAQPNSKDTPVAAAIKKVVQAVGELQQVYRRELACVKGRIAERDLTIDELRAKLIRRPARTVGTASKEPESSES